MGTFEGQRTEIFAPWTMRYWRVFPRRLEADYEAATRSGRALRTQLGLALGVVVFLAALGLDYAMGSEPFARAVPIKGLHLAVSLAGIWMLARSSPAWVQELLVLAANLVVVVGAFAIAVAVPKPYDLVYFALVGCYALGVNYVFELRLGEAIRSSLILAATYFASLEYICQVYGSDIGLRSLQYLLTFSCLVTIIVPFQGERYKRQVFLANTRTKRAQRALARANEKLRHLARIDGLTGLHNRRSFDEELMERARAARASSTQLGLVLLDVDYFKIFNDMLGHQAGDECLQMVAQCLRANVRADDLVFRYGGEEFAVLLSSSDFHSVRHSAERLRLAVAAMQLPHPREAGAYVTISLGAVSVVPSTDQAGPSILRAADDALYEAKRSGRNCSIAFDRVGADESASSIASGPATPEPACVAA